MARSIPCLDDPNLILEKGMCLSVISKDFKNGKFGPPRPTADGCRLPECKTLKTSQTLVLTAQAGPCERDEAARRLNGQIKVAKLVTAYVADGKTRGFHSGDFVWAGAGFSVAGRMSGVTNVGTHRAPVFKECQSCGDLGVMEGRLCGQIVESRDASLKGCQIVAAYRIRFEPSSKGIAKFLGGVLEGVLVCPCRK